MRPCGRLRPLFRAITRARPFRETSSVRLENPVRTGNSEFAKEYVPGLPITAYCDEKRLSPNERLLIFTKVYEGVQRAHQKAIIHRDPKPTNILVVEVDGLEGFTC